MDGSKIITAGAVMVEGAELLAFIERAEVIDAQIKDLQAEKKELMAEAKGRGFMTRLIRMIVNIRSRNPDDIAEEAAVMDAYKAALGMQ